jgi:hypothetical protein
MSEFKDGSLAEVGAGFLEPEQHVVIAPIAATGSAENPNFEPTSYVGSRVHNTYDVVDGDTIVSLHQENQLIGVVEGVVTRIRPMPEDEVKKAQSVLQLMAKTHKDYVKHVERVNKGTRGNLFSRLLRSV